MTEMNTAHRNDAELPEDDDPLAELARIVAGEPAPKKAETAQSAADDLDIEAELMRELGEAEPAPIEEVASARDGQSGFSFSRTTPVAVHGDGDTQQQSPSLEDQLMAELEGEPPEAAFEEAPSEEYLGQDPAARIEAIAADLAVHGEATDSLEAATFASSLSSADANATGGDTALEDFFTDNFADMLESEQASELDRAGESIGEGDLSDIEFDQAFAAELEAVDVSASDEGTVAVDSVELDLEDDFARAFESEIELEAEADPAMAFQPSVEDIDDPVSETRPIAAQEARQASGNNGFKLAVGALCLALLAGIGVVAWGSLGGGTANIGEEPPVIKAESEPAKIKPEEPGGTQIANQDNQVYDKVAGNETDDTTQETLISSREEVSPEAKSTKRLTPQSDAAGEQAALGISPKKVRTFTVKPDGTIVQAKPAQTATLTPPVSKPVEPAPEQASAELSDETPTVSETASTEPQADEDPSVVSLDGAKSTGEIAVPSPSPLPAAQELALASAQTAAPAPKPVAPAPKPVAQQVQQAQTTQSASDDAPTQIANISETPRPSVSSSEWKIQVSSQRSREAAEASFNNIRQRFGSVLGDRSANIQRADVEGKGTFYRVKVLASSKSEASEVCSRLKAAGGSCFVTR